MRSLRKPYNIKHKLILGVGLNDYNGTCSERGRGKKFYTVWEAMLRRCYSKNDLKRDPTYQGCSVCEEWRSLTKFKEWFDENYVEGYQLDKDLLVKGNKVYSPDTCVFLPQEINKFMTNIRRDQGECPVGVTYCKDLVHSPYRYSVHIQTGKVNIHLGSFKTKEEAFSAYKEKKEAYAKVLAEKYKDTIDRRAYDALMSYQVNINDRRREGIKA